MASVALGVDLSPLIEATQAGDSQQIVAATRVLVRAGADIDVLIGRIGMIAAYGDHEGHLLITLDAASELSRWLNSYAWIVGDSEENRVRALPLLVQALVAAAPAVRAGRQAQVTQPDPFFPSGLPEGKSVASAMHDAIHSHDTTMVERLLLGLYGTGADYRTMQVRAYDGIATTFRDGGHALLCAVRGFQLLDAVEWGNQVPHILHWLAPHLPVEGEEPAWVQAVCDYLGEATRSLGFLRKRIAAPKNASALPLQHVLLSNVDAIHVCQAVYDALIEGGASASGVASIIALTATDLLQRVGDDDREAFYRAAHGLLFAGAVRLALTQVQDIEAVPLIFTAATYINALHKELGQQAKGAQAGAQAPAMGGGLIAPSLLETILGQLTTRDYRDAFSTTRRYLQLGHEARPLFATIGLAAAQADAVADQGHTLQIVQAAGEEFMAWPKDLGDTNKESFVRAALRAATFAGRNILA